MNDNEIHLTREELYGLVWSEPMQRLAKRFNISDVGLAKICKKMNIPRPERGYWQRKERGYAVKQIPLPSLKDPYKQEIRLVRPKSTLREGCGEIEPEHENIIFEKLAENRISVHTALRNPHPYVGKTMLAFKGKKPDEKGIIKIFMEEHLDVQVSPKNIHRALCIMDALLKAFEKRGYSVNLKRHDRTWVTSVTVLGENMEFGLIEHYKQTKRQEEPNRKKKDAYLSYSYDRYDYHPSDRLELMIKSYVYGSRKSWSDGVKHCLENLLNSFMIGLVEGALKIEEMRITREREEQKRQEIIRVRQEKARLIEEEKSRIRTLEMEAANWLKSQQIRSYVEAVRTLVIQTEGQIAQGSEAEKWLTWASQQADRFDPLAKSSPSILDEVV
jgi:hypothetical protein